MQAAVMQSFTHDGLTFDVCRFEVLDRVSHWLPEEVPAKTAEIILARVFAGTEVSKSTARS